MSWASVVVPAVVALFFLSWVRAVGEDRRLVIYRLGNYAGFKGPGLVLVVTPFDRRVVLAIGDQGETVSANGRTSRGYRFRYGSRPPLRKEPR